MRKENTERRTGMAREGGHGLSNARSSLACFIAMDARAADPRLLDLLRHVRFRGVRPRFAPCLQELDGHRRERKDDDGEDDEGEILLHDREVAEEEAGQGEERD